MLGLIVGVGICSTTPIKEIPYGIPGRDLRGSARRVVGKDRAIEAEGGMVAIKFRGPRGDLGGGVVGGSRGVSGGVPSRKTLSLSLPLALSLGGHLPLSLVPLVSLISLIPLVSLVSLVSLLSLRRLVRLVIVWYIFIFIRELRVRRVGKGGGKYDRGVSHAGGQIRGRALLRLATSPVGPLVRCRGRGARRRALRGGCSRP